MQRRLLGLATSCAVAGLMILGGLATTASVQAQATQSRPRMVPPVRGTAQIGYLKPVVERTKDMVITKITVKNLSAAPIAGLKIDEFWYDRSGNALPSDSQRYRKPLQPGEVVEITLQTPYNRLMNSNKYNFTHANGDVKATLLKTIDEKPTS